VNLKQGLFRLWVGVAVLWVSAWIYYLWTDCFPPEGLGKLVCFSTGHYGVPPRTNRFPPSNETPVK
jgi:hypothetical protein